MFCRCGSEWQCDFTHNRKQVVNRLKILQGLSMLLFHRWSEVPSRGGVHGDSAYEKLPALQKCNLSVLQVLLFSTVFVLSSISSGSFNSECFLWCVFSYTFLYQTLLAVLFWLAFPSVSLFLVYFLGVVQMSQPVAG